MARSAEGMSNQPRVFVVALSALAGCFFACACQGTSASQRASRQVADHATPDQARLWRDAADRNLAPGLEKLSVPANAIDRRQRGRGPVASQAAQSSRGVIAPAVRSAVRIVKAPVPDLPPFAGVARVVRVTNEEIELALQGNARVGEPQNLVFVARIEYQPLSTQLNEELRVEYRSHESNDPFDVQQILAVKTKDGDGIVRVGVGGRSLVSVSVPLFQLIASQLAGTPPGQVDVSVSGVHGKVQPGQIVEVGQAPGAALCVGLLSSRAYSGADVGRLEGSPYWFDLVAWPRRPANACVQ